MIINITTAYALRILLYMAQRHPEVVSAREVVAHLNMPDKYIRRLMTRLSKANLIESQQGRSGGYIMAVPPNKVSLLNIAEAMHDTTILKSCILGFENCSNEQPCALHTRWIGLRAQIAHLFSETFLNQLLPTPI